MELNCTVLCCAVLCCVELSCALLRQRAGAVGRLESSRAESIQSSRVDSSGFDSIEQAVSQWNRGEGLLQYATLCYTAPRGAIGRQGRAGRQGGQGASERASDGGGEDFIHS